MNVLKVKISIHLGICGYWKLDLGEFGPNNLQAISLEP